ncbi:MAG: Tail Collar domain protein [Firmicutes bacterium]|nr:Tail Collar domain protein [Bacillota bacterium]
MCLKISAQRMYISESRYTRQKALRIRGLLDMSVFNKNIRRKFIMSRTVNVNEEFVVVSKGKEDLGKFAVLGDGGKFDPSVIPVIEDLQKQIDKLKKSGGATVGAVEYFARFSAPEGWLKADGSAVSRVDYANLFDAVGTMFGDGDGSTTFNLPDLRGEFVRGFDDSRGIDKGRVFGSKQKGSLVVTDPTVSHNCITSFINLDDNKGLMNQRVGLDELENISDYKEIYNAWIETGSHQSVVSNSVQFGFGVSRPRNIALLACIKY